MLVSLVCALFTRFVSLVHASLPSKSTDSSLNSLGSAAHKLKQQQQPHHQQQNNNAQTEKVRTNANPPCMCPPCPPLFVELFSLFSFSCRLRSSLACLFCGFPVQHRRDTTPCSQQLRSRSITTTKHGHSYGKIPTSYRSCPYTICCLSLAPSLIPFSRLCVCVFLRSVCRNRTSTPCPRMLITQHRQVVQARETHSVVAQLLRNSLQQRILVQIRILTMIQVISLHTFPHSKSAYTREAHTRQNISY